MTAGIVIAVLGAISVVFGVMLWLAARELQKRSDAMAAAAEKAEESIAFWHDQWLIRGGLLFGTEEALKLAYESNAKKTKRLTDLAIRDGHRVIRGLILPDLQRPEPGRSVGPTPIYDALVAERAA